MRMNPWLRLGGCRLRIQGPENCLVRNTRPGENQCDGACGEGDEVTAVVMAFGSLTGVYYGSKLSVKMPEKMLRGIVMGLIPGAAVLMLLHQGK